MLNKGNKKTKVLVRFDDICPSMNWEQWYRAKSLLDSIGATALIGVIPECKDPDLLIDNARNDYWKYIKDLQSQGYVVAMHGYQHVFDIRSSGMVTPQKHSEFAGHPYDVQYEKIKRGKSILLQNGIETDVFFAPAHSYDSNTLKALAANGFKYNIDGMSYKPYKRFGVICIPARSGGIPKIKDFKHNLVVLHSHEWVREEKKHQWNEFESLCKSPNIKVVSFQEYSQQKHVSFIIGRISELIYYVYNYYAIPFVVHILKWLGRK